MHTGRTLNLYKRYLTLILKQTILKYKQYTTYAVSTLLSEMSRLASKMITIGVIQ